jgi:hypothetical protein
MNVARIMAVCFAALAALGISGIALAGPGLGAGSLEVTALATPSSTPSISDLDTGLLPTTVTPTVTITPTMTVTPTATVTPTVTVTGTVPVTMTRGANEKIAEGIAKFFGVPISDVLKIRNEMGWGGVVKVFGLAEVSGKSVDDVLALRENEGWGQVARALGIKPGHWGGNLGQIMSGHAVAPSPNETPPASSSDSINSPPNSGKGNGNGKGGHGNGNGKGKGK